jgi:hypothetical protein
MRAIMAMLVVTIFVCAVLASIGLFLFQMGVFGK